MNQNNSLFAIPFAVLLSVLLVFSASAGVFAQTPSNTTTSQTSDNSTGMPMNHNMYMGSHETKGKDSNLTSSVSIFQPIINAFKSMIKVDINYAVSSAQGAVGDNATTIAAFLHPEKHFIVYTVIVLDSSGTPHKVLVDPGNGNVLKDEKTSFMELMMLAHGGMMGGPGSEMGMMGHGGKDGDMMGHGGKDGDMMGHGGNMMGLGPLIVIIQS